MLNNAYRDVYELLARVFATRTSAEWIAALTEADIPVIEMNTPESLLDDPHMNQVGLFIDEDHPSEGRLRSMRIPAWWSADTPEIRYPAPRQGDHTAELLADYGFDRSEVDTLLAAGAVHQAP